MTNHTIYTYQIDYIDISIYLLVPINMSLLYSYILNFFFLYDLLSYPLHLFQEKSS